MLWKLVVVQSGSDICFVGVVKWICLDEYDIHRSWQTICILLYLSCFPNGNDLFQQENIRWHETVPVNTKLMSSYLPDLNSIEHLLDMLQTSLNSLQPCSTKTTQLWASLKCAWFLPCPIEHLIESILCYNIVAVISAKWEISYYQVVISKFLALQLTYMHTINMKIYF